MSKRYFVIWPLLFTGILLVACAGGGSNSSSGGGGLPDIATFATTPSDQFLLNTADLLAKVPRAHPYKGAGQSCAHAGAHLHFTNTGAPYEVPVYSPVGGTISTIKHCFDLGNGNDSFQILIQFATYQGSAVKLVLSFEPFGGRLCGTNPNFYDQYILVKEGQAVTKGDLIAKMSKTNSGNNDAHIHFHLSTASGHMHCPNIFSSGVVNDFAKTYGTETCSGTAFPATFCYLPATGEDLTGL